MKITFIRPSITGKQSADALKPLAFMILFSLTPKDIEVDFYDECIEKLPQTLDSDAVCFSVETFSAKRAYLLANKYKSINPNIKVIMGGFHPSACPDEANEYADSVIIGDAEPVWEQVIKDLQSNELQQQYISSNSHMLPFEKMDKSIFDNKKYSRKIGTIQWKRGCTFNCNFCAVHSFYKSCILERDVDDVICEIKNMKEKVLFIADDNLLHDRAKLKEFLTKLIPLRKKWVCQISINIANDDEMLKLMSKSGCIVMIIGFESLNVKTLAEIRKTQNVTNNDYEKAIQNIYSHKIMIFATFIFGTPNDTIESFEKTYAFVMKHKFLLANFNLLMATPATDLYTELQNKKKLIHEKWWLADEYTYGDAIHYPDNYSALQLAENCKKLRYNFCSATSIVKRMFNPVNFRRLHLFLLLNIVSALGIKQKQETKLGGEV